VEVYREPTDDAQAVYGVSYRQRIVLEMDEQVSPLFAPNATIPVAQLLP
jgi:hypothetical protein